MRFLARCGLLLVTALLPGCATSSFAPAKHQAGIEELTEIGEAFSNVQEACRPSLIRLKTTRNVSVGRGVIVDANGLFVTAAHVVSQHRDGFVATLHDGKEVPARSVFVDHSRDLAFGKLLRGSGYQPLSIRKDLPKPGEWVTGPFTYSNKFNPAMRGGRVRYLSGPKKRPWYMVSDLNVIFGSSGGAVLDTEGRLVGVLSWTSTGAASGAVPLADVNLSAVKQIDGVEEIGSRGFLWSRVLVTNLPDHFRLAKIPMLGESMGFGRRPELKHTRQDVALELPAEATASVVECLQGRRRLCLGTMISSDGKFFTKASEVLDRLDHIRLADGRVLPARKLTVDLEKDLLLGQVEEGADFPYLSISKKNTEPEAGNFLISPLPKGKIALGMRASDSDLLVTFGPPKTTDVTLKTSAVNQGLRIDQLGPKSVRQSLGLEPGDILVNLGKSELTVDAVRITLQHAIDERAPVNATIFRDTKMLKLKVGPSRTRSGIAQRTARFFYNLGEAPTSQKTQIDNTFRHDTVIRPHECGGPILDLEGNFVGINIARVSNDFSLSLPSQSLRFLVKK